MFFSLHVKLIPVPIRQIVMVARPLENFVTFGPTESPKEHI
jgi:hypothetical protein